jgi:hypothetical protein
VKTLEEVIRSIRKDYLWNWSNQDKEVIVSLVSLAYQMGKVDGINQVESLIDTKLEETA